MPVPVSTPYTSSGALVPPPPRIRWIVPRVVSVYRWENAVTSDDEQLLIIKTTDERVDALRDELFARHPYDVRVASIPQLRSCG